MKIRQRLTRVFYIWACRLDYELVEGWEKQKRKSIRNINKIFREARKNLKEDILL